MKADETDFTGFGVARIKKHASRKSKRGRAGATWVGALFLVAVVVVVVAGIVYIAGKIIDRLERIQIRPEFVLYTYLDANPGEWMDAIGPALPLEGAEQPMYGWGLEGGVYKAWWSIWWTDDLRLPWVQVGDVVCTESQVRELLETMRDWDASRMIEERRKRKSGPHQVSRVGFYRAKVEGD